jgi:hypothetical protein
MLYLKGREDAQTWRDKLIGKRIVTSSRHVADHDSWKSKDASTWEPRVYYSAPLGEGLERTFEYSAQPASPLLRLPAEIRNLIMQAVLPPHVISRKTKGGRRSYGDATWLNTSAIIFCCKQLYVEGRGLALELHTFDWNRFPRNTRLCAAGRKKFEYDWNR